MKPFSYPLPVVHGRFAARVLALSAVAAAVVVGALALGVPGVGANASTPWPAASLRVGIDPAALPLSNGDRDYTNEGHESAYARELAAHLGVTAVLVPLAREEQARALGQGEVDLVLARDGAIERPGQRGLATGYRSGLSVAMRSDTDVRDWSALAGRVLCAPAENAQAQAQVAALGGQLKVFYAPAQALMRVRTGECDAAILDRAPLDALFAKREWAKFSATLPPVAPRSLTAWVAEGRADRVRPLRAAVAQLDSRAQWERRHQTWASNVAFEVYFDQTGPDCH